MDIDPYTEGVIDAWVQLQHRAPSPFQSKGAWEIALKLAFKAMLSGKKASAAIRKWCVEHTPHGHSMVSLGIFEDEVLGELEKMRLIRFTGNGRNFQIEPR